MDFGEPERRLRTTIGDIARAATVSLIDTTKNETASTAKTTDEGRFQLNFVNWLPTPGTVYILEGVKGLDNNRPSSHAARVRTLARFSGGEWVTITAGRITINTSTTALSIIQGLYQANNRPGEGSQPGSYIGLIESAASAPGQPDPLRAGQTVVSDMVYQQVFGFVRTAVTGDRDPVASTKYKPLPVDDFWTEAGSGPTITGLSPDMGTEGTFVTIYGANFKTATESNTVTFNGVPTNPVSSSETSLVVKVPPGATSGPVKVTTAEGESGQVEFAVIAGFDGRFEGN